MVQKLNTTQDEQNREFYTARESIKIKVHENSTPLVITHVNDFRHHFPEVDLSPTST